jgi:hypothetical protein
MKCVLLEFALGEVSLLLDTLLSKELALLLVSLFMSINQTQMDKAWLPLV